VHFRANHLHCYPPSTLPIVWSLQYSKGVLAISDPTNSPASSGIQGFPAELWMRIVDPQFVPVLICYCSIQMNREHSALRMRTSSERIETEPRIFECCYPQLYSVENRRKYLQQSCSSFRSANISATHATRNDPRIGPGCISCSAAKSVAWLIGTNGYDVAATGSQI
jgi:hypothetical protein